MAAADSTCLTETRFPVVFIHGVFGYGRNRPLWNRSTPYWPERQLRQINANHVIVDVGVVSSDHDRACEVFFQLFGGMVDYGEQHARKARHERFGATFDIPLCPQWSERNPVHLVGHSFGATTAIELYQLLCTDFFNVGSNYKWVRSLVSIAGPLTGTTLTHVMGIHDEGHHMQSFSIGHALIVAFSLWYKLYSKIPLLKNAYDLRMEQWRNHSLKDLASVSGPVNNSKDTALFGALPAVRILRNSKLQHMDKLYLMSITTCPRSLKNVPSIEIGLTALALVASLGKFPRLLGKLRGPGVRALAVTLLSVLLWRRVKKLDLAKMPSFAGLMWLMRRRVNSLPQIFDGFEADHWEHNDGAVNIHSMLRPWFPKPAEVGKALSEDAQAASIPASTSSSSLLALSEGALVRCESHISINGFHAESEDISSDAPASRTFNKGRWYVYRVDSNHLAGTYWQNEVGDLYKSLFTLMVNEYEKNEHQDEDEAKLTHTHHRGLQHGMTRSQSSRQLPRTASFS